jgi:6-phosphogluconate dehydrogenase
MSVLGFIGLGRMGFNMVKRLLNENHQVTVYNRTTEKVNQAVKLGAMPASSLSDMVKKLTSPRIIWLMLPAGEVTDAHIDQLTPMLEKGDILVEGGNAYYKDSMRRSAALAKKGIHLLDVGTSGGIWGLKIGYCLMIGGDRTAFQTVESIFKTLAPKDGYSHVGSSGAGHFVKMVHNGIEYGMLQAYGEGFALLKNKKEFDLNLESISHLWNQGSVIRSWLLELAEKAFNEKENFNSIHPYVEDSGEGRWTVLEGVEQRVPLPVISLSLFERFQSRLPESFSHKVIAALRQQFGGHAVKSGTKNK